MTDQELVRAVVDALQAHHDQECLVTPDHCKVRWRRRMALMVVVIIAMYAVGEVAHLEALVKGWEFLGAAVVDKLIFGIATE